MDVDSRGVFGGTETALPLFGVEITPIISWKKGNRKSEESNFYSSVLLSENLYPEIVKMERFEIR